jgi:DNA-directed RNA polymerase specialized sigma24 family protein
MMSSTNWGSVRHSKTDQQSPVAHKQESGHLMQEEIDEQLSQLVAQTCKYPRGSVERRIGLNHLIQAIVKSGKLWWENTPYYEDALQQTWLYLCRNLCEVNTGAQYDPERSSVTTWLNFYLKKRLLDFRLEEQRQKVQQVSPQISEVKQTTDPLENLAAPSDIQPMLEEIRHLVETDSDGELRSVHIKGRPDLTCQVLILRRLPPKTDWKILAAEFGCSFSTLANFYQRQCQPRLRKLGELQGYL